MSFGNLVGWWLLQGLVALLVCACWAALSRKKTAEMAFRDGSDVWRAWMLISSMGGFGLWLVMQ